jgi:hypothetical protein
MMAVCLWSLAAILVLGLIFSLAQAYGGSLVFATYPGPLEFMGHRRLSGTIYVSIKWQRDPGLPGSCPLVVHLPAGDAGAEQLAVEGELLKLGLQEVPYPPMPPEAAALLGPNGDPKGLGVVRFGLGDLRLATQHTDGQLTGVWVWVVDPGHETVAWSPKETQYLLSVHGQPITLPLTDAELVKTLGDPRSRRKDY